MPKNNPKKIPIHIGFILDGNRRWAKSRGLPTYRGHRKGYDALKTVSDAAFENGVKYVTAFIFSTENWNRTKEEVDYLMGLALRMVKHDLAEINKKGIRVLWLGSEERVSNKLSSAIKKAVEVTKNNVKGTLCLCFNYGGQKEIADGVKKMIADGVKPEQVDEILVAQYLYEPSVPPVDILVRTSGERRISNFMLWRAAYSELMFVEKHWPDFNAADVENVIAEYSSRHRRFGA